MKSLKKTLLSAMTCLMVGGALTGCRGEIDKNTLNIVVLSAGYGDEWIKEIETKFEAEHSGINVEITAEYDADNIIKRNLESKKNTDDLYISVGAEWKSYAAQGKFLDLTEFLNDKVDGVSVKDRVSSEYQNSLYYTHEDGEKACYRLPWTSGIGGIFYNKAMFEQNEWEIPTTFEELLTLCDTINNSRIPVAGKPDKAVKPFAYTGDNTDYFDYTVFDWWGQIAGVEAVKEFLKYESYENFDATKNETYAALKTATSYWEKLFVNSGKESDYVIENSIAKTAEAAQKEFANGYAAMMFNGDWLYNELKDYNIELGLMKTPIIREAKEEFKNTSYVIGEDQYIAIPATSDNADMAKEFIKLIISNEGCLTFTKKANGFLAYKTDYTNSGIEDEYINDAIELRDSYTHKFTNFSSNSKYLLNYVDIWSTGGNRPYLSLLNGSNTLDSAFATITTSTKAQWSSWEE